MYLFVEAVDQRNGCRAILELSWAILSHLGTNHPGCRIAWTRRFCGSDSLRERLYSCSARPSSSSIHPHLSSRPCPSCVRCTNTYRESHLAPLYAMHNIWIMTRPLDKLCSDSWHSIHPNRCTCRPQPVSIKSFHRLTSQQSLHFTPSSYHRFTGPGVNSIYPVATPPAGLLPFVAAGLCISILCVIETLILVQRCR